MKGKKVKNTNLRKNYVLEDELSSSETNAEKLRDRQIEEELQGQLADKPLAEENNQAFNSSFNPISALNSFLSCLLIISCYYFFSTSFLDKPLNEQETHFEKAINQSTTEHFFETKSQEVSKTFGKLWLADDFKSLKDFSSDLRLNSDISALKHFEMPVYFNLSSYISKNTSFSLRHISLIFGTVFILLSFYLCLRLTAPNGLLISSTAAVTLSSSLYSLGLSSYLSPAALFLTFTALSFILLDSAVKTKDLIKSKTIFIKIVAFGLTSALCFLTSSLFPILALSVFFPLKKFFKTLSLNTENICLWASLVFVFSLVCIWPAGIIKAKLILSYYINYFSEIPVLENSKFISKSLLFSHPLLFITYLFLGFFGLMALFSKAERPALTKVLALAGILALGYMVIFKARDESIFVFSLFCLTMLGATGMSFIPKNSFYNLRVSIPLLISLLALSNAYQHSPLWLKKIESEKSASELINANLTTNSKTLLIGDPGYFSSTSLKGSITHLPAQVKRTSEVEIFTHAASPSHVILMKSGDTHFEDSFIKSLLKLGFSKKIEHDDFYLYSNIVQANQILP